MWHKGIVLQGQKVGRSIGFSTINLDPQIVASILLEHGVYASRVKYGDIHYSGALYLGPRLILGETVTVLEIHILNFDQDIYGQLVDFQVLDFIRPPENFYSLESLKKQIQEDIVAIKKTLNKYR